MIKRLGVLFVGIVLFSRLFVTSLRGEELKNQPPVQAEPQTVFAGRIFEAQVPLDNYLFVKGVISVFGNKFGSPPANEEEEERLVWDQLLLSYEAFRRGVTVNQEEVEEEVKKILQAQEADFDFKSDATAYEKWVKEKVNASAVIFENQIRHLLQIQKLRQQVMDAIEPRVSEAEARQEFLNEYNSLSVELVEFADLKEAQDFYNKAKARPGFWDEEKAGNTREFRRPGFVALEFLMDIWKFPKEALYKMIRLKPGSVYSPVAIYKGYAAAKVLETRPADEKEFEKPRIKESYYEQIRIRGKYEGLDKWFEDLRKQANVEVYK